jgi:hypothetical protein
MSRSRYNFFDQQTNELAEVIEFDLIDNPGCRAWQYAVLLNDKARTLGKCCPFTYVRPPANIDEIYNRLKNTINQLEATDFPIEFDIPESFDQADSDLMNRLHRHFTNSCYALWDYRYAKSVTQQQIIDAILHELNELVHELEIYMATPHRMQLVQQWSQEEVYVQCDGRELGYDIFPFRQYHSFDQADLILDGYILGKTLLQSYVCYDDPASWDTAGHMKTNGGAAITVDDVRQQIYNSSDFNKWLRDYGVEKHQRFADFPLGHFVPGHRYKIESLKKELWKYSSSIEILL